MPQSAESEMMLMMVPERASRIEEGWLDGVVAAVEVGIDEPVIIFFRKLLKHATRGIEYCGIAKHTDSTMGLDGLLNELSCEASLGDAACHDVATGAMRLAGFLGFFERGEGPSVEGQCPASLGQSDGGMTSDACAGSVMIACCFMMLFVALSILPPPMFKARRSAKMD